MPNWHANNMQHNNTQIKNMQLRAHPLKREKTKTKNARKHPRRMRQRDAIMTVCNSTYVCRLRRRSDGRYSVSCPEIESLLTYGEMFAAALNRLPEEAV